MEFDLTVNAYKTHSHHEKKVFNIINHLNDCDRVEHFLHLPQTYLFLPDEYLHLAVVNLSLPEI